MLLSVLGSRFQRWGSVHLERFLDTAIQQLKGSTMQVRFSALVLFALLTCLPVCAFELLPPRYRVVGTCTEGPTPEVAGIAAYVFTPNDSIGDLVIRVITTVVKLPGQPDAEH